MKSTVILAIGIIFISILSTKTLAATGTLQFNPQSLSITKGQTLTSTIVVSSDVNINKVLAKINYPNTILKPQSIDTSNSFVTLWYQNSIGTGQGQLILEGGVSSNGTSGTQLVFAKINFETIGTGPATVAFDNTSTISQASDGTNILSEFTSAIYTVTQITPSATPTLLPSNTPTPTLNMSPTTTSRPTISITGLPKGGTTDTTFAWGIISFAILGLGLIILKNI